MGVEKATDMAGIDGGDRPCWRLQMHRRGEDVPDPHGPPSWPRRPPDMGGFLSSIEGTERRGRKHAYDPPSGYVSAPLYPFICTLPHNILLCDPKLCICTSLFA